MWDEPKRVANLRKRGLDFADATSFEWRDAVLEPAKADETGPLRFKAIGYFLGSVVSIIFATLGTEAISIISFRTASLEERRKFHDQT